MAQRIRDFLTGRLRKRSIKRWSAWSQQTSEMDLSDLRDFRAHARQLRRVTSQVIHESSARMALPRLGSNAMSLPLHTEWAYRPEVWRGPIDPSGLANVRNKTKFGDELEVFHDCKRSEITMRQLRNTHDADLAPFGLSLDVLAFEGSFLSLVIEMPKEAVDGLKRQHIVTLAADLHSEEPVKAAARINVRHGPNTEQLLNGLTAQGDSFGTEFDLAYTDLNERRADRMWIELLFENAHMNRIVLRDLTLSRRPRSEI